MSDFFENVFTFLLITSCMAFAAFLPRMGNGVSGAMDTTAPRGMSLRDWFAGQALAGYFANPSTPHRNAEDCADYMYRVADAMLKERAK